MKLKEKFCNRYLTLRTDIVWEYKLSSDFSPFFSVKCVDCRLYISIAFLFNTPRLNSRRSKYPLHRSMKDWNDTQVIPLVTHSQAGPPGRDGLLAALLTDIQWALPSLKVNTRSALDMTFRITTKVDLEVNSCKVIKGWPLRSKPGMTSRSHKVINLKVIAELKLTVKANDDLKVSHALTTSVAQMVCSVCPGWETCNSANWHISIV